MFAESINTMFVGHLNDPAKLAGVGLGNLIINMFGVAIIVGMNGALETLVSQAYGSGNLYMAGVYLNRGRFIVAISFVPIFLILNSGETILVSIGQDPEVSHYAAIYIRTLLPGIFFMA
jgi:MATE family multidrug resistance protein